MRYDESRRSGIRHPLHAEFCADLSLRLRPSCADMPTEEFDALVSAMSVVKLRWQSLSIGSE
jgi:hypothetical protein